MILKRLLLVLALVASLAFVVAACGDANDSSSGDSAAAASSDGRLRRRFGERRRCRFERPGRRDAGLDRRAAVDESRRDGVV